LHRIPLDCRGGSELELASQLPAAEKLGEPQRRRTPGPARREALHAADVAIRTDASDMTDVEAAANNFASSARAGRRNAIPDIQGSTGTGGISGLPLELQALSIKEDVQKKNEEATQDQLEKPPNEEK
ncbi:cAMP-dependent protein kinase inhibitor beta, partial [Artibeus jamaicensis]|uniref:cAMP-dependent protein kinase inhibitor beta n=1 Tax=Artibeus jamaicensis TaxID=9417 RepID=UPI00235A5943